jgi:hypothetical protein
MTVEELVVLNDAASTVTATLDRSKWFRHLLKSMNYPEGVAFFEVKLATAESVRHAVIGLPHYDEAMWQTLEFWQLLFGEMELLTATMLSEAYELRHHNPVSIRTMFAHLTWLLALGVLVPLVALSLPESLPLRAGLTGVAVGGVLGVVASGLVLTYRWVTERPMEDEGQLEVMK